MRNFKEFVLYLSISLLFFNSIFSNFVFAENRQFNCNLFIDDREIQEKNYPKALVVNNNNIYLSFKLLSSKLNLDGFYYEEEQLLRFRKLYDLQNKKSGYFNDYTYYNFKTGEFYTIQYLGPNEQNIIPLKYINSKPILIEKELMITIDFVKNILNYEVQIDNNNVCITTDIRKDQNKIVKNTISRFGEKNTLLFEAMKNTFYTEKYNYELNYSDNLITGTSILIEESPFLYQYTCDNAQKQRPYYNLKDILSSSSVSFKNIFKYENQQYELSNFYNKTGNDMSTICKITNEEDVFENMSRMYPFSSIQVDYNFYMNPINKLMDIDNIKILNENNTFITYEVTSWDTCIYKISKENKKILQYTVYNAIENNKRLFEYSIKFIY